jgi:hypothetical protein
MNYKELVYTIIKESQTVWYPNTKYYELRDKLFILLEEGEKAKKELKKYKKS